jgi:probable F420-dependent oxidoreductase
MKFGLMFSNVGPFGQPEGLTHLAQTAERVGVESLWTVEHVAVPIGYESKYPYSEDGKMPGPENAPIPDPLIWLSYAAAVTSKIKLATGILILPQRHPIYTAKEFATLDVLSQGRAIAGIGIGWLREEFDALGVPFAGRAKRTREYLEIMKTLWCDDVSSHSGDLYQFEGVYQHPKPLQQPHPPIYFGGESEPALQRVAELGQGWYGFRLTPEDARQSIERLDKSLAQAGRSRAEVKVCVAAPSRRVSAEDAKRYRDLGIDQLILPAGASKIERFASILDEAAELAEGA